MPLLAVTSFHDPRFKDSCFDNTLITVKCIERLNKAMTVWLQMERNKVNCYFLTFKHLLNILSINIFFGFPLWTKHQDSIDQSWKLKRRKKDNSLHDLDTMNIDIMQYLNSPCGRISDNNFRYGITQLSMIILCTK